MTVFNVDVIHGISFAAGFEYVDDEDIEWYAAIDLGIIRLSFVGYKRAY